MLKHLFTLLLLICTLPIFSADVKYIFVLIGDGFGPSQRALAEAAIGKKLVMNTFPCAIPTGTDTHDGKLTDSAASGTAIACGIKTYAHAIGVDKDKKPVESLACELKRTKDFAVGIISSCGLTDATPASQYAHQPKRNMYGEIAEDMFKSEVDFFGGCDLIGCNIGENRDPAKVSKRERETRDKLKAAGYTLLEGKDVLEGLKDQNTLLGENPSIPVMKTYGACLPYVAWEKDKSDAKENPYPTLADYLTLAAERFASNNKNGFFIMLECGKIDHAGHSNNSAWTIREVRAFDEAVEAALKFQEKYPDETLVVVTADHETGGLQIVDEAKMKENAKLLWKQTRFSYDKLDDMVKKQEKAEKILKEISTCIGFKDFSKEEEAQLIGLIETNYAPKQAKIRRLPMRDVVKKATVFRDKRIGIQYTTGSHTKTKVITNVSGPGWELFTKQPLENSSLRGLITKCINGER